MIKLWRNYDNKTWIYVYMIIYKYIYVYKYISIYMYLLVGWSRSSGFQWDGSPYHFECYKYPDDEW